MSQNNNGKSLESWLWDAACVIRGEKDAPKYKDYILPLVFVKRLCDVFDDEINRISQKVGNRIKAFNLVEKDHKVVRFYLPIKPKNIEQDDTWSVTQLKDASYKSFQLCPAAVFSQGVSQLYSGEYEEDILSAGWICKGR